MPWLTLKPHAQPGLCLHHNHQQQIPWTNPALPLGKPLPPLNAASLQQKLNNGEVTLNGVTATGSESVTLGQTLVWNRPPWIEPDSPQHFEVLFEDPHLLAVNKPSGLPTLPGGGFMENTLLRLVQKQTPNANPVHRLGRATTGIVLFAKTPQAASNLFANWNTPKIRKIYRALAQNIAQQDAYEILTPIGLVPHPLIGSVWAANPSGKPSKSLAKVISRAPSSTASSSTASSSTASSSTASSGTPGTTTF